MTQQKPPQKNSKKSTDLLLRRLDLLLLDKKWFLFKTNKTINTTIKKSNDQNRGDDRH
jgi:hypothetical protein